MNSDFQAEVGGKNIVFNTGELAKQADGSVTVTCGDTVVFATAVAARNNVEGRDFFPLSVEYREKYYASGKIPGGYVKREGRPSDHEVLTCRITDRPLRPLFPKDFLNEVQIILYVVSSDRKELADVLAINAASAALSVSCIPFKGPVGAVRVGKIDGELVINPTLDELENSVLDLVVAGTKKAVTMIEGLSENITEDEMLEAVLLAHENIKVLCEAQLEMQKVHNKPEMTYVPHSIDTDLASTIKDKYSSEINKLNELKEKQERDNAFSEIVKKVEEELAEQYPDTIGDCYEIIHDIDKEFLRAKIIDVNERPDGRSLKDIRQISIKPGVLKSAHGSSVFTRGQTQSLGVVTLGTEKDAQKIDTIYGLENKRFMLHYNFPPFSVGECGRFGGTGRREIGHGMLAERALKYIIPDEKEFPYTIRLVSEILESNGSSSMASVCSGSLALFNAGVPVKAPIAGIAMGLILDGDKYAVLSDILGIEDHLGDMDFKVAGTETGITAFQLDIKIEGITPEIMKEALQQAKEGRLHILSKMNEVLPKPEDELSDTAPRCESIKIATDKIGGLIGPGGKNIRAIVDSTGADVNVAEDGTVQIYAVDKDSLDKAKNMVTACVAEVEEGKIYEGTVKRIMEYGAFVEVLPGKEGLLHISKMDVKRVNKVTDVLNIDDKVMVKVLKVDRNGRVDLSRKDALDK
jgi:polyribonucleotide nucleotidyltransferase